MTLVQRDLLNLHNHVVSIVNHSRVTEKFVLQYRVFKCIIVFYMFLHIFFYELLFNNIFSTHVLILFKFELLRTDRSSCFNIFQRIKSQTQQISFSKKNVAFPHLFWLCPTKIFSQNSVKNKTIRLFRRNFLVRFLRVRSTYPPTYYLPTTWLLILPFLPVTNRSRPVSITAWSQCKGSESSGGFSVCCHLQKSLRNRSISLDLVKPSGSE